MSEKKNIVASVKGRSLGVDCQLITNILPLAPFTVRKVF